MHATNTSKRTHILQMQEYTIIKQFEKESTYNCLSATDTIRQTVCSHLSAQGTRQQTDRQADWHWLWQCQSHSCHRGGGSQMSRCWGWLIKGRAKNNTKSTGAINLFWNHARRRSCFVYRPGQPSEPAEALFNTWHTCWRSGISWSCRRT